MKKFTPNFRYFFAVCALFFLANQPTLSQTIDVGISILNSSNNCSNAIGTPQCRIKMCHDIVEVTVDVSANTLVGLEIQHTLPSKAVVVSGSAQYNGSPIPSNCNNTNSICFTETNGVVTWKFPSQSPAIATAALSFKIAFDCSLSGNSNQLITACDVGEINQSPSPFVASLGIDAPNLEILGLPITWSALLGDDTHAGQAQAANARTFRVCATGGEVDAFKLSYVSEPEISNVTLVAGNSTFTNPTSFTNFVSPIVFNHSLINSLIGQDYIEGNTNCIYFREEFNATTCSLPNTVSSYTVSVICNDNNISNLSNDCDVTNYGDVANSDMRIAELGVNDLTTSFVVKDHNGNLIPNGLAPCDAANQGFQFEYAITNPPTTSGYAPNSNFKSLNQLVAKVSLGTAGQQGWFLSTPTPLVYINNIQITNPNAITVTQTAIVVDFTQLGNTIAPLTDLNYDNISNELPGNSTVVVSIRGLKLNLLNTNLDNCASNITQYIVGASATPTGNYSKVTYSTMCAALPLKEKFFNSANFSNQGNSVIYGAPVPADAQAGVSNQLNMCWENTGAANNNPWFFENGTETLLTCAPQDLEYQLKLTLPQSLLFTSNPNLVFTPLPGGLPIPLTLPTPTAGSGNSQVFTITGLGRSGCLTGNVKLNAANTNVCDVPNGLTSGNALVTGEIQAVCNGTAGCEAVFCIGSVSNNLFYHCPGACTGALTGVHAMSTTHPIIFRRIDDLSDNLPNTSPDLQRAYVCDYIEVEVHGYKAAGTPNDVFLKLTYEQLAGTNPIFSVVGGYSKYSVNGGLTWSNLTSVSAPTPNGNLWTIEAHVSGTSVGLINTTQPDGFRFQLRLKVRDDVPAGISNGVFNLQDVRADIGYMNGNTFVGACDNWADHMLVLAHTYNTQTNFIQADNPDYGAPSLGVCHQRLLIRNYIQGGLPQSSEMPNENRPLLLWPNNNPHTLRINTDLQDLTPTGIHFFSNTASGNIPLGSSGVSISGNDLTIFGIETSPGSGIWQWPSIPKNSITTLEMRLLVDFDKQSCEAVKPATNLFFPHWTKKNSNCNPASPFMPNSTAAISINTIGNQSSSVSLTINNGNAINASVNPVVVPLRVAYTGYPYFVNNGFIFPVSSNSTNPPILEIRALPSGTFVPLNYQSYFFTGPLSNQPNNPAEYELRITYYDCVPQTITFLGGYTCANDFSNLPAPSATDFDCEVSQTVISINPKTPTVSLQSTGNLTYTPADNCSTYDIDLDLKATQAYAYEPNVNITVPVGSILTSCSLIHNGVTQPLAGTPISGATSISLANELQTLLQGYSNANYDYALPTGGTVTINAQFTGDVTNCVTGSVTPSFDATWLNLCGVQAALQNPLSATFNFVPNSTLCPTCVPCFTYKPEVTYLASGAGCNNQQGTISIQITYPNGQANVSNVMYHYQGINGNTLNGTSSASNGTLVTGLSSGDYEIYLSYNVTVNGVTTQCSTEPETVFISIPNCCLGDVTGGSQTKTIDGTVTPVYTSNLTPSEVAWLNTSGNVSINGTFIVNTLNFVISNCHLTFGENAIIRILSSPYPSTSSLSIENSTLETCEDWMWWGIFADGPDAILGIYGSTIRDAQWAVRADNSFSFASKYSNYENNHTGISIANSGAAFFAPIIGCNFTNPTQDLKNPLHGNRTLVGIQTQNVDGWQIGEDNDDPSRMNRFIGINSGIYSFQSNITVYNNYFQGIKNYRLPALIGQQPQSVSNYPFRGWAVYALSGFFEQNPGGLIVRTNTSMHWNVFDGNFVDCDGAIYAGNSELMAYYNNIFNCKSGIKTAYGKKRTTIGLMNMFWNTQYGITMANNNNGYSYLYTNSFLNDSYTYNSYPFGTLFVSNSYGIYLSETSPNLFNEMYDNRVYGTHTGIKALRTGEDTWIDQSIIDLTDNVTTSSRRIGVSLDNCNGTTVREATITGNNAAWQGGLIGTNYGWSANRRVGIFANNSRNLTLNCNWIKDIGRALLFRLDCTTDKTKMLRENNLDNAFVNLYLERLGGVQAKIGAVNQFNFAQSDIGEFNQVNRNSFKQNTSGFHTYNYMPTGSGTYTIPRFWYRSSDPFQNDNNGSNVNNMEVWKMQADPNADAYNDCVGGTEGYNMTGGGNPTYDALKALELTNYPNYEDFLHWQEQYDLFKKLSQDSAYRSQYNLLNSFYADKQQQATGKLYDAETKRGELQLTEDSLLTALRLQAAQEIFPQTQILKDLAEQLAAAEQSSDSGLVESIKAQMQPYLSTTNRKMRKLQYALRYKGEQQKIELCAQTDSIYNLIMETEKRLAEDTSNGTSDEYIADIQLTEYLRLAYSTAKETLRYPAPDTIDAETYNKLMEANLKLQEIGEANNYEQNEKRVKEWLNLLDERGPDAFTEELWQDVLALANACPLSEGYAVYTARALYAGYDHTFDFEDISLCEQAGFFKTDEGASEPNEEFQPDSYLYYEHRDNRAMLVYHISETDAGKVDIFNVLGQPIANAQLEGKNRLVYIDIPQVASGEYLYKIRTVQGYISQGKFLIIK